MKIKVNEIGVLGDVISLKIPREHVEELHTISKLGKPISVEIKQYRAKRSLDANALFWKAVSLIAEKTHVDNEKIYIELLRRYGVFTHIIVKQSAVQAFKATYRLCEELGEVTVNGQTGMQLCCWFGSSTYSTKQMARLIDGVLSELKELEIPFVPESDITRAKEEWGR